MIDICHCEDIQLLVKLVNLICRVVAKMLLSFSPLYRSWILIQVNQDSQ